MFDPVEEQLKNEVLRSQFAHRNAPCDEVEKQVIEEVRERNRKGAKADELIEKKA